MKQTLLLFLSFIAITAVAQDVPATYTSDLKAILESAKKNFKGDQGNEVKALADNDFDKLYESKFNFQGAAFSQLVTDKDDVLNHHAQFKAGVNKEAAMVLLGKFIGATQPLLPPKYKESENIIMRYVGNRATVFQYDSDNFSEVSNHVIVTIGLVEKNGSFLVDLCITAPTGF